MCGIRYIVIMSQKSTNDIEGIDGMCVDPIDFQTQLNKNVDNYLKNTEVEKIRSFKKNIYDEIVKASCEGKNTVTIDINKLFRYDLFRNFYIHECACKGLKWISSTNITDRYVDVSFERKYACIQ